MNILDYLDWRGDLSFEDSPLNRVDALILSHIIYLHFDNLVDGDFSEPISLGDLADRLNNSPDHHERIDLGLCIDPRTVDLFFRCAEVRRFRDVKITGFIDIFDPVKIEQFAVTTFLIGDDAVISFRGTDDTIIGFYEDFNLSYMDPLPSQVDASDYFDKVIKKFPEKNIVLVGHSKGGYIALGTAVRTSSENQKRIKKIYNLDGPGYIQSFFETEAFKNIEPVLDNLYPEDDYVGMLQRHSKDFTIVKAENKGLAQHNPLNWQVIGNDFVKGKEFTKNSQIFSKSINEWSENISYESKEKIVHELFSIYLASDCKSNQEISQNKAAATKKIIKAFNERNKDTKEDVMKLINILVKNVKTELPVINIFSKINIIENGKALEAKLEESINEGFLEVKKLEEKIEEKFSDKSGNKSKKNKKKS